MPLEVTVTNELCEDGKPALIWDFKMDDDHFFAVARDVQSPPDGIPKTYERLAVTLEWLAKGVRKRAIERAA